MQTKAAAVLAVVVLIGMTPAMGSALAPYSQDFEGLALPSPGGLLGDGWLVYGNVFSPGGTYLYGYGPFPAPNDGAAFCAIAADEGGAEQGAHQLSVYSDYNNGDHAAGNLIEANVFQEQTILPADVGNVWIFEFQAKLGNLVAPSTAAAFIKTLDPGAGYAMTNFITADMTAIPTTWSGYSLSITIDSSLAGQILQFGFMNTATYYQSSGVFYDNVNFRLSTATDVPGGDAARGAMLRQNYPNPFNPSTRIDFALESAGPVELSVFDAGGRRVATLLQRNLAAGEHHAVWNGRTDGGRPAPAGQYYYLLETATTRISRGMVLVK